MCSFICFIFLTILFAYSTKKSRLKAFVLIAFIDHIGSFIHPSVAFVSWLPSGSAQPMTPNRIAPATTRQSNQPVCTPGILPKCKYGM